MAYMSSAIVLSVYGCLMFWAPQNAIVWFARRWSGFVQFALDKLCGVKMRVEGLRNLPRGRYIIASKHQSAWETISYQTLFYPVNFLSKKEMLWLPLFGFTLWKSGNILVERGSTTRKGLSRLIEAFKATLAKRNLCVFPEGTRTAPGAPVEYKSGLGVIASRIGDVVIVPVAHNAGRFWPKNSFMKTGGTITVRIGRPIRARDFAGDRPALDKAIQNGIESMMLGL
ncbi:MAG: 1-acyl-sn-glycerol-3-phosphate acyltransferase [Rickettsiales bacterium]|jgi:1-acyl-sn-glycerol-3-phosphate acyltransferase|nr:1-acyl-sn-glycerol-3-phosphate acyltransferase [Rickettsiales bacterium]